jgi:hypothetical protein
MQLRSSARRASRASRHARHSSGVHFFLFITVLLLAENRENAARVDVDVGERPHHQAHLVAVDALLLVYAITMPDAWAPRKMSLAAEPGSSPQRTQVRAETLGDRVQPVSRVFRTPLDVRSSPYTRPQ